MAKKIISQSMLYKVCKGIRNLGTAKAKEIAKHTKTDPMLWMDRDKASGRKAYQKALELSGLIKN